MKKKLSLLFVIMIIAACSLNTMAVGEGLLDNVGVFDLENRTVR